MLDIICNCPLIEICKIDIAGDQKARWAFLLLSVPSSRVWLFMEMDTDFYWLCANKFVSIWFGMLKALMWFHILLSTQTIKCMEAVSRTLSAMGTIRGTDVPCCPWNNNKEYNHQIGSFNGVKPPYKARQLYFFQTKTKQNFGTNYLAAKWNKTTIIVRNTNNYRPKENET